MINQRDKLWAGESMGGGDYTIGNSGCYLVSLCQGLVDKGYNFNPHTLNEELKNRNLWDNNSYIKVDQLPAKWNIFKTFQRIDNYIDVPKIDTFLTADKIVLCQVDARAIGGTGTHFVYLNGYDGNTAVIGDPWTGTNELVTKKYNKYGNILGLRIFGIINNQVLMNDQTKYDFGGDLGEMEMQAVRSTILDQRNNITQLNLSLSQAKQDLLTEEAANKASVDAINAQLETAKKNYLDDISSIALALGKDVNPDLPSIQREIAILISQSDQLDNSQRLTKAAVVASQDPRINFFNFIKNWFKKL